METNNLLYHEESYVIIGACMEVHNALGHGYLEAVYKDAMEVICQQDQIPYSREKLYDIQFRDVILPHKYQADFVVFDKIIIELKCVKTLTNDHIAQTINYLKVSGNHLALLINFANSKLEVKRLVR